MMVVLGDMDNFMLAKMEARDHQLKKKKTEWPCAEIVDKQKEPLQYM